MRFLTMNVVALAGGVGGAKLVDGLSRVIPPENLTIIVNTGDDFEHLGLKICPDLDTVCYTLAGLANPETGWGRVEETWNTLESLAKLDAPTWFQLGDKDLATHLERTRRMRDGQPLSQVTRSFCQAWGVKSTVLPMSDDLVPTQVFTDEGEMPFQEYFVHRQCKPSVRGFRFEGVEGSHAADGVVDALAAADLIIICPSNPWVSIDPILAIPEIMQAMTFEPKSQRVLVAVSPIIGGETVKGPASKMLSELGIKPSALAEENHYDAQMAADC
jgi:LPPG:FO 2-phospho-L-lactate transferase